MLIVMKTAMGFARLSLTKGDVVESTDLGWSDKTTERVIQRGFADYVDEEELSPVRVSQPAAEYAAQGESLRDSLKDVAKDAAKDAVEVVKDSKDETPATQSKPKGGKK